MFGLFSISSGFMGAIALIVELFIKVNGYLDCCVSHQDLWMYGLLNCSLWFVGAWIFEFFIKVCR